MRKVLASAALALAIALTGCNAQTADEPLRCEAGYVVEYDDDGAECEIDENGDGVDDENEDEAVEESEDEDSDRKKKSRRSKRRH